MAFILDENYYTTLKSDLDDFLESSEANAVMLCDRGGNIIVHTGESVDEAIDIISALVAGAFAATKELAKVLGEEEFTAIFHQGVNTSIFISAVGEEVLVDAYLGIVVRNPPAAVTRYYTRELDKRRRDFQRYQVNADLMSHTQKGAVFMHSLPAHSG